MFLGKGVLKIYRKLPREQPCWKLISTNLLYNFIEIALWHDVLIGVLRKRCSENIQKITKRTTMLKTDFNKFALQLYWNRTLAWCSVNLPDVFRTLNQKCILINQLTHFISLVSFHTPWKHQKALISDVFREYKKKFLAWNGCQLSC